MDLYTLSPRNKTGKPLGEGVKKQLEQLNIAEILSGICCLLSTVYQSLYLHLGPGLTGESTGALNEMDERKLGEQTAPTAATYRTFFSPLWVARCRSRPSVPVLGSARGRGTRQETAKLKGSLSTRTSAPSSRTSRSNDSIKYYPKCLPV